MTIDELGRAMRAAREKLGFSQEGAGLRAGLGVHVVHNIEKGKQFPCWERLEKLCKALKIDAGQFKEMYDGKDFGGRVSLTRTEFMDSGMDTSEKRGRKPELPVREGAAQGVKPPVAQPVEVKRLLKLVPTVPKTPTVPTVPKVPKTITQTVTASDGILITVGGYRITINRI